MTAKMDAMNSNCPISTPMLKKSSATGIADCGSPSSLSALAKPRSVQQAEGEGDDPRKPLRNAWSSLPAMHDFRRHEDNAQCNAGFDRRPRNMHESERCTRERQAVGNRECRDGSNQADPFLLPG